MRANQINHNRRMQILDLPSSMEQQLDELIGLNQQLDQKVVANQRHFKDVLIYCKKTIEKQDEQIKRLDGIVERSEIVYEEKLKKERLIAQQEYEELKLTVDKLNSENLLMKTQLGNQEQNELELKEMRQKLDVMRKELDSKSEKIGRRELKDRELVMVTTEKVRRELEVEFAEEIQKIQKELRIQNLAQVEANQQIVKKVQNDLLRREKEKEYYHIEMLKAQAECESLGKTLQQYEMEKKRFEGIAQKGKQQSEKMIADSKRQLDEMEKARTRETQRFADTMTAIKKENSELKKEVQELGKELGLIKSNYDLVKNEREKSLQQYGDQNAKLSELKKFLTYVLEEKNDQYIDTSLGDNRNAIFTKLLLLLQNVPGIQKNSTS
ncbi:hypothetical protein Ddc_05674 [Ditylenchus destructor]|nr:hypothetical protein Ddc_05674 [Ditylenchus destructor]